MKRIIFVVTFAAALLQLNNAADTGNAPEQRTEGELLSLVGAWKRFAGKNLTSVRIRMIIWGLETRSFQHSILKF